MTLFKGPAGKKPLKKFLLCFKILMAIHKTAEEIKRSFITNLGANGTVKIKQQRIVRSARLRKVTGCLKLLFILVCKTNNFFHLSDNFFFFHEYSKPFQFFDLVPQLDLFEIIWLCNVNFIMLSNFIEFGIQ